MSFLWAIIALVVTTSSNAFVVRPIARPVLHATASTDSGDKAAASESVFVPLAEDESDDNTDDDDDLLKKAESLGRGAAKVSEKL